MGALMLTALNAATDAVLDLTAMTIAERDLMHGTRIARRNGAEPLCRHCHGPVHLCVNHHHTAFWRHNPNIGRGCLLAEITTGGESPEHLAAKYAVVQALRSLNGWTAEPEQRFERNGDVVIVDVFAHHDTPAGHQTATAWEAQISPQTRGAFVSRTEQIHRVAGHRAAWITPHDDALGEQLGIVTDPTAELIIGRIYTRPDEESAPLGPMPTGGFVKAVARRHPTLLWTDSGENRRWIAYPPDAVGGRTDRPTKQPTAELPHLDRENCNRTPDRTGHSNHQPSTVDSMVARLRTVWPDATIRVVENVTLNRWIVEAWQPPIGRVDARIVTKDGQ